MELRTTIQNNLLFLSICWGVLAFFYTIINRLYSTELLLTLPLALFSVANWIFIKQTLIVHATILTVVRGYLVLWIVLLALRPLFNTSQYTFVLVLCAIVGLVASIYLWQQSQYGRKLSIQKPALTAAQKEQLINCIALNELDKFFEEIDKIFEEHNYKDTVLEQLRDVFIQSSPNTPVNFHQKLQAYTNALPFK